MMSLDVEGRANIFKLSESDAEQLDDELSVVKERFLVGLFNFNPHHLLQLQSLLPTSSLVAFNFNPHCQLHPLPPTSTLVAFNLNPRRLSISKPHRFSISSPSP
jgi:hypothetical protein